MAAWLAGRPAALAVGLLALLVSVGAAAADLTEVRIGRHPDKTRVVIEADGAFTHRLREGQREIVVDVSAGSDIRTLPAKGDLLRTVQVAPSGDGAQVRLVLRGDVSLQSFTLAKPDRLVLDLYPAGAAPAPKTAAAPARTPAPAPAPKPAPKAAPKVAPAPRAAPPAPEPAAVARAPEPAPAGASEPPADEGERSGTRIQIPIEPPGDEPGALPASPGATRPVAPGPEDPDRLPADSLEWEDLADAKPGSRPAAAAPGAPGEGPAEASAPPPTAAPRAEAPGAGIPRSTLLVGGILLFLVGTGVAVLGLRRRNAAAEEKSSPFDFAEMADDAAEKAAAQTGQAAAGAAGAGVAEESPEPTPVPSSKAVDLEVTDPGAYEATRTAPWPATAAAEPAPPAAGDLETTTRTPVPGAAPDTAPDAQTSIFEDAAAESEIEPPGSEENAVNETPPTESPDLAATIVSPGAPPPAPGMSSEASRFEEMERRIALLETRLEELVDAKERLERQVVAQTEELRVQRAAIARTQRVLRGMARPEDEATEPAPKT